MTVKRRFQVLFFAFFDRKRLFSDASAALVTKGAKPVVTDIPCFRQNVCR